MCADLEIATDPIRPSYPQIAGREGPSVRPWPDNAGVLVVKELNDLDVFTTQDARRLGLTDSDLRAAVNEGAIVRLKRGWYTGRPLPWPEDRHRLLAGIEQRTRQRAIASHYSAVVLLGLPVFRPDWSTVHLMRTQGGVAQNRDGLVIHKQVADFDRPSVPLAVAQTSLLSPISGLMAYDAALRAELTCAAELKSVARALDGHAGRANLAVVRRLGDRRRESPLESRTALVYDRWRLTVEPQFCVPGTTYITDGRIVGTNVLIECDGDGKYPDPSAVVAEKNRENDIRALGWSMVRVTEDLLDRPRVLYARTQTAMKDARTIGASAA